jgi:hypothetical protein
MSQNAAEVRIAGNGGLYVAPVGTALPTDPTEALNAAFIELGYSSEDGVTMTPARTIEKIKAWQSRQPVRTSVTEESITISTSLMQWNESTIAMFFGGGSVATDAGPPVTYTYTPPAAGEIDERALVLEWIDGEYTYRLVSERAAASELGEVQLTSTAAAMLPITLELLAPTGDVLTTPFIIITDDPSFAA